MLEGLWYEDTEELSEGDIVGEGDSEHESPERAGSSLILILRFFVHSPLFIRGVVYGIGV